MSGRADGQRFGDESACDGCGGDGGSPRRPALSVVGGVQAMLTAEQEAIVMSLKKLIEHEVKRVAPDLKHSFREDLVAAGTLGAMLGVVHFDPARRVQPATYLRPWIDQQIRKARDAERLQSNLVVASRGGGRDFVAMLPDQFDDLVNDPEEVNAQRLNEIAANLAEAKLLRMASEPLDPEASLGERESHAIYVRIVQEARASMSHPERAAMMLLCVEDPSVAAKLRRALIQELGVDERSVRRYAERALQKLRTALDAAEITMPTALEDRGFVWAVLRKVFGVEP